MQGIRETEKYSNYELSVECKKWLFQRLLIVIFES